MTFGQKLQQLRKARGMSQEDLAGQLSVTRQTVSKWELDQSTPDLPYLAAISEFFGVSTDYLIKEQMTEPASPVEQVDMNVLLAQLKKPRPSARQVFFVLFLIGLGGIVFPMLLLTIAGIFDLDSASGDRFCLLTFMVSTFLTPFFGIFAAFLTYRERKNKQ